MSYQVAPPSGRGDLMASAGIDLTRLYNLQPNGYHQGPLQMNSFQTPSPAVVPLGPQSSLPLFMADQPNTQPPPVANTQQAFAFDDLFSNFEESSNKQGSDVAAKDSDPKSVSDDLSLDFGFLRQNSNHLEKVSDEVKDSSVESKAQEKSINEVPDSTQKSETSEAEATPTSEMVNHTSWLDRWRGGARAKGDESDGNATHVDPEKRFSGDGQKFRCKLFGSLNVEESRGDEICQNALLELKLRVRVSGQHKQRIQFFVNTTGLTIKDEKTGDLLFQHPIEVISFIAPDANDGRAFGYVVSVENSHKYIGIRTERAALQVILAIRDLFTLVFEKKKSEVKIQTKTEEVQEAHSEVPDSDTIPAVEPEEVILPPKNSMSELLDIEFSPLPTLSSQTNTKTFSSIENLSSSYGGNLFVTNQFMVQPMAHPQVHLPPGISVTNNFSGMENIGNPPFQMQTPNLNMSPFTTQGSGHNIDLSMRSPFGLNHSPQTQASSSTVTLRTGMGNGQAIPNQFGKFADPFGVSTGASQSLGTPWMTQSGFASSSLGTPAQAQTGFSHSFVSPQPPAQILAPSSHFQSLSSGPALLQPVTNTPQSQRGQEPAAKKLSDPFKELDPFGGKSFTPKSEFFSEQKKSPPIMGSMGTGQPMGLKLQQQQQQQNPLPSQPEILGASLLDLI